MALPEDPAVPREVDARSCPWRAAPRARPRGCGRRPSDRSRARPGTGRRSRGTRRCPRTSNSGPATANPARSPASVAASKRATVLPRRPSSIAVATAMKPRIDGMLAAVAAPSRSRVPRMSGMLTVAQVMTTATSPKNGPHCMTCQCPRRSDRMPKSGDRIELGRVERRGDQAERERIRDRRRWQPHELVEDAVVLVELGEVVGQHRAGEPGAEAQREGAGQHGPQRSIHCRKPSGARSPDAAERNSALPGPYHPRHYLAQRMEGLAVGRVAIVTDSASDFDPARAASLGIAIVPLVVTFGNDTYSAGRRPLDRRVLAADDRARRAVPEDGGVQPGRLPDDLPEGLRRRRRVRSSRSMSRTRCRARSRPPRSRRRRSRTARSSRRLDVGASMGEGILAELGVQMANAGASARRDRRRRSTRRRDDMRDLPRAGHARIPQARRPDQRRPGRDRHAPVGQADHRGQGRQGRDGRSGADARQGPRAAHRAPHRAPDRAAVDPAHDRRRRRGVRRRARRRVPASTARRSRSTSSGRPSGRTSARAASVAWRCTPRARDRGRRERTR